MLLVRYIHCGVWEEQPYQLHKALTTDIIQTSPTWGLFLETFMFQHALAYTKPVPRVEERLPNCPLWPVDFISETLFNNYLKQW